MNTFDMAALHRHFDRIGAQLAIATLPDETGFRRSRRMVRYEQGFRLDIQHKKRGEVFELAVNETALPELEVTVMNVQPEQRHLLLMLKRLQPQPLETVNKTKFLCGYDERHWFAAEMANQAVSNVWEALESMKPDPVVVSQQQRRVRTHHWHRRRNAGFVRQGEWFFLPVPDFAPDPPAVVLHDEPLRRGNGKPHWVEWLHRTGGEIVYANGNQV
jgi:hypothetical protein